MALKLLGINQARRADKISPVIPAGPLPFYGQSRGHSLQDVEVLLELLVAAAGPVRLVAHEDDVRRQLAHPRGLHHRRGALLQAQLLHHVVERLDAVALQPGVAAAKVSRAHPVRHPRLQQANRPVMRLLGESIGEAAD